MDASIMGAEYRAHRKKTNRRADESVIILDGRDQTSDASVEESAFEEKIRRKIRELWPGKTIQHISIVGDVTLRNAARIMAREQGISARVLRGLTNCEYGDQFLAIQQENCRCRFWQEMQRTYELAEIERAERALAERKKRVLGGEGK
jgi:hypothetical protein